MSIQYTITISKENAIERICKIINKIDESDWIDLNEICENEDIDFKNDYINEYNDIYKDYTKLIKKFNKDIRFVPNNLLENFLDKPGIRFSVFENYLIKEEE